MNNQKQITVSERVHEILVVCSGKTTQPGSVVLKLFSCSTQLNIQFTMLINVKMPTIVGILAFISMINTTPESIFVAESS